MKHSRLLTLVTCVMLAACATQRPQPSQPPAAPGATAVVVAAAGDIAQCGNEPAQQSNAAHTAALLEQLDATVLAAGDLAYTKGTASEFQNCYEPTWGRFKARTLPVPGNHEYLSPDAQPYYDYWGAQAGERGKGYYATQRGTWRIIALNSNIDATAESEQARWLRAELARHTSHCTLAFWHHPMFSSGKHGDNAKMAALWRLLYDAGADLVIVGHEHNYERFAALDASGEPDPRRGMRQIVAGTGGAALRNFGQPRAHSEVRNNQTFGVLKLTLGRDGYDWQFIPVEGQTFSDHGAGICHD